MTSRSNWLLKPETRPCAQKKRVIVAIYKSLFIPHLNYGSLLWGHNFDTLSKLQKKVVRTITNSAYMANSEPILKGLNLLKVQNFHELIISKFLYKLYANDLPIYFDIYRPHLNTIETLYAFCPHPLPVPQVAHVYAAVCCRPLIIYFRIFLPFCVS